jgi:hypothetical protein
MTLLFCNEYLNCNSSFHYSPSNLIELNWIFNLDQILLFLLMIVDTINTKALTDHYHYMYIYIHPGFILQDSFWKLWIQQCI